MTNLSLIGKLALALHIRRNPTHVGNASPTIIGLTSYHCATCGYPLTTPEEWAADTGQPLATRK